jgi:hypothetical protein
MKPIYAVLILFGIMLVAAQALSQITKTLSETSGMRPDWVDSTSIFWIDKGLIYFQISDSDFVDVDDGLKLMVLRTLRFAKEIMNEEQRRDSTFFWDLYDVRYYWERYRIDVMEGVALYRLTIHVLLRFYFKFEGL